MPDGATPAARDRDECSSDTRPLTSGARDYSAEQRDAEGSADLAGGVVQPGP
jgi:hypothetical protein